MVALEALDGAALARVITTFRDTLRVHQDELNRLNVYPVPDGDTGTNMALTLESVCAEVGDSVRIDDVCQALSHGSLMGARGNSGVILSQILRGLSDTFASSGGCTGKELITGLRVASDAAYQAVMRPVEGTILTAVRCSAEAAEELDNPKFKGDSLVAVLERATQAAQTAVDESPELLPALKDAGVVDAGGRGFTLLLWSFLNVVDGRETPEPEEVALLDQVAMHQHDSELSSLRYEVMYLLEAEDAPVVEFKKTWGAIGDSIVVVGGGGLWNCHIHTNDIGAAVEAGIQAGRPREIRVTDLIEQVEEEQWVRTASEDDSLAGEDTGEPVTTGVVAVAVGRGLQRLLGSVGVREVIAGGQSMNPSTAQILEAVDRVSAEGVIVLPNNKNIVPVAQRVEELTERKIGVVPTHSVVEGLSALMAYDPSAPLEDNVEAMTAASSRVRTGEVTQAVRDSVAECGPIAEGDWLAISREGICSAESSPADAVIALIDRLVQPESELVTVLLGTDARSADVTKLREYIGLEHSDLEMEVHEGNQPLYPFLIGVE